MTNDEVTSRDAARPVVDISGPDPHGPAALLLVESLIHGLCEKSVLSVSEALEIVDRAVEVQSDQAEAADGAGEPLWRAHALLIAIAASLRTDLNTDSDGTKTGPRLVT